MVQVDKIMILFDIHANMTADTATAKSLVSFAASWPETNT